MHFVKLIFGALFLFFLVPSIHAIDMDDANFRQRHGDLPQIIEHQSLRILVSYDNVSFFMNKGKQDGLYVALINKFREYLVKQYPISKDLKMYFIPVRQDEMVNLIATGYGDIAMGLTPTDEFKRFVDFSIPEKLWLNEIIVTSKGEYDISNIDDLSGRYITVRQSSSYYKSLKNINVYLKSRGYQPIKIIIADEYLTDADLVDMVDKGEIKATVINDSKLQVWKRLFKNVVFNSSTPVKVNGTLSWGIRHDSPILYKAINGFLRSYRDGTPEGTKIYERYMRWSPSYESRHLRHENEWLGISADNFKKYSQIFRNYGEKFNIDWMLLMAQSYQESTLNPSALSKRGAVGIMQVLPSTAGEKYINVNSVSDIENNVHAGTKYMRYMLDNYFSQGEIPTSEKLLFALASYNSGPNRITRYRKEAVYQGLDPNKWFDNVEKIAINHGADETVQYVRNISSLYISYQKAYNINQNKKIVPKF